MPLHDRVLETSTTTGTSDMELAGTLPSYVTFIDGVGDGNSTWYSIEHETADEFEVGQGTVHAGSPDTLTRDEVYSSSNGDALVDFSGGEKRVFVTVPAKKIQEALETYVHTQALASTTWTVTHNLKRFPSVTIVDSGGNMKIGAVDYVSDSQLTVSFSVAFGGKAYLN